MKRIAFLVVVLALTIGLALPGVPGTQVSASPGDLTITTARTFISLDGSLGEDDDGVANGVLTVKGNLLITSSGSITQVAPNPIRIVVTGNMQMDAGSFINDVGSGSTYGGAINITVGNFTVTPPTGTFAMANGATINANGFQGGAIVINAAHTMDVDGLIKTEGHGTGAGTNQGHGGTITLDAGCYLRISDTGVVRSKGLDPGADLVHLESCEVVIYGLVESTGPGHAVPSSPPNHLNSTLRPDKPASSTAGVEVWGGTILIDKTGTHKGEINADLCCGGGTDGTSWIDLLASSDITIIGSSTGNYAVHANGFAGNSDTGGVVTVESIGGKVTASGLAVQADGSKFGGKVFIEAESDITIVGLITGEFAVVANGGDVTNGIGGQITVKSKTGKTTAGGLAFETDSLIAGGDGGQTTIEAFGDVILDDAKINSRGDWVPTIGYGGTVTIRSYNSLISWRETAAGVVATGDVRPTGDGVALANRGVITFQKCTTLDTTGTLFLVSAGVATTPTTLADSCGGAPVILPLQSYVVLPPCDICVSCRATLKIIKVVDGTVPASAWEFTSNITGHENFTIPAAGGSVTFDPIDPGTYSVTETAKAGYGITPSNPQQIVVGPCEHPELTFTNTFEEEECKWCTKSAVLSQVTQNMGLCCAVPDILVDLRLGPAFDATKLGTGEPATGSIQAAIDYVNSPAWVDPNPDGQIFIGVTGQDCGTGIASTCGGEVGRGPYGNGMENVVITNTRTDRMNVFGCSVTLTAADAALPVITIQNSVGKVTVLDIHVTGSNVAGYVVQNNADLVVVKNCRAKDTTIGYWVKSPGGKVEITGSPEISGNTIGILIEGSNVTLRTNSDIINNVIGIKITGDNNTTNGNEVGTNGHPNGTGILVTGKGNKLAGDSVSYNTGDGLVISGSGTTLATGNKIEDEDAGYNGNDGIVVSGNYNTVLKCKQTKYNGGDGIEVSGSYNLIQENVCEKNSGNGFNVSGNNNTLKKNQSKNNTLNGILVSGNGNILQENTGVENNKLKGFYITGSLNKLISNQAKNNIGNEFTIAANNNVGSSGNKYNGIAFTITAAGGSVG